MRLSTAIPIYTVALAYAVPLVAVTYETKSRAVREAMELAQQRVGLSDKVSAAYAEVDQSQWTKQRTLGGILGRLVALPREFWVEFLPLLGQIVGVSVRIESDDDRLERVVRRALKAELRAKDEGDTCVSESRAAS